MPIGLKEDNILYHGTSAGRAKSIAENGFKNSPLLYDRWLSPNGIYFVSNRPLIALRSALYSAGEDDDEPVVMAVNLCDLDDQLILDLTSDVGLNSLYRCYVRLWRVYKREKHAEHPRTPDIYFADLASKLDDIDRVAIEMLDIGVSSVKPFNWDSAGLRLAAMESNCQIIVAAFQEGTSFNRSFSGSDFNHGTSKNYKGLKYRDHIEVCVLDASIISTESMCIVDIEDIKDQFDDIFINAVIDIRNPDS